MEFTKIESAGNDYIVVDCKKDYFDLAPFEIKKLCQRNFGIGADGLIKVYKSDNADAKMEMFNSDGTVGAMCGNGALSVAKLLHSQNGGSFYSIETSVGNKLAKVVELKDKKMLFSIEMGTPKILGEYDVSGYKGELVDVGNKHLVFFVDKISEQLLYTLSRKMKTSDDVLKTANIEIATIKNGVISALVFEKGSNKTLSCGTGAVATAFCAVENGFIKNQIVSVEMQGGTLSVTFNRDKKAFLSGKPNIVYKGNVAFYN